MDDKFKEIVEFIIAHREVGIKPHKILEEVEKEFKEQLSEVEGDQFYGLQLDNGTGIHVTYINRDVKVKMGALIVITNE
tara:strand:- start:13270 stop:13506 length:237 start_codon:yes stop_codon:yes gene_type:complete